MPNRLRSDRNSLARKNTGIELYSHPIDKQPHSQAVDKLRVQRWDEVSEWDAFVDQHPQGTIFHRSELIKTFQTTKRHFPYAYAACDADGKICALLVAVKISTLGRWADLFAARSIFFAEPIYLDTSEGREGVRQLIEKHDQHMRRRTLFSEVRPFFAPPGENDPLLAMRYEYYGYLNYVLDVGYPLEVLFKRMDAKCRNNIRTTLKRGLVVEEVEPLKEMDRFYGLVALSYANARVPLADRSLFESAFRLMSPPRCRLFLAKYQNETAAAACFLAYKDRVVYWYAGAKRIRGISAMSCILWEAISKYSAEGYTSFDFAGAGWEGEYYGPGRFKAKFGGTMTNYGRYRCIYSPQRMKYASSIYELVRGWLSPRSPSEE